MDVFVLFSTQYNTWLSAVGRGWRRKRKKKKEEERGRRGNKGKKNKGEKRGPTDGRMTDE